MVAPKKRAWQKAFHPGRSSGCCVLTCAPDDGNPGVGDDTSADLLHHIMQSLMYTSIPSRIRRRVIDDISGKSGSMASLQWKVVLVDL